jgi:hypothetical protein
MVIVQNALSSALDMRNHTLRSMFLCTLAALAVPATAQSDQLTMEQSTAIRCSAAFAIVANDQAAGNRQALQYPPLAKRGREYMVRSSARLMDERQISRDAVAALLGAEVQRLRQDGLLDQVMPSCLALLDASGI